MTLAWEGAALPEFSVRLSAPDLGAWREGNVGIPGVWRLAGAAPGPRVAVVALIHGNEIGGAIVLDALLRQGTLPARGELLLILANLAAYDRFDPENPTASRFVDEDMNRVWDREVLEGGRHSVELARARALRPVVERADVVLDLHSMLWPGGALTLCGPTARGQALAACMGTPELIVADTGHAAGRRLIDYAPFVDPGGRQVAVLVEAGQHWDPATPRAMAAAVDALLGCTGLGPALPPRCPPARRAAVTHAIAAATSSFAFVRPFESGEVIAEARTLIATDGGIEVRTPYDACLLVMPSLRPSRGHTAVRLARFVD